MFDFARIEADRKLRFDLRSLNKDRTQEEILSGWVLFVLHSKFNELDERVLFPESRYAQTLPEVARHLWNLSDARTMMPVTGPNFQSDKTFNAWCDAYRATGLPSLADLLETTREIRPTHEKEQAGIEITHEEGLRIESVCQELCSYYREVDDALCAYTLKHRAELERISPMIREIFGRYDRRVLGHGEEP